MPRHKLTDPNYRLVLRGSTWYVSWTDAGRTRSVSTGTKQLAAAQRWRDQFIAGRENPPPPPEPTISEILDGYLAARLPKVASPKTLEISVKFVRHAVGNLRPEMLRPESYSLAAVRGVADGTIRREAAALRAALRWAKNERWISDLPYVAMPSKPAPRDRWLTRAEIDRLILGAKSPHTRLFIVMAYHTAARVGAILDLTWDRVDFEHRRIDYARPGRRKTNKRRIVVPMNVAVLSDLQAAHQVAVSDHVIEFRGRPVRSIRNSFAAACKRAGIKDCSPHILRHSAATHLVMANLPMTEIARMLGDSVAMIEQVYGKHSPDYLRRASEILAGEIIPSLILTKVG